MAADLPGAAHLMLVEGVTYLDPEPAVFEAKIRISLRACFR
jgi:hypothetical protein